MKRLLDIDPLTGIKTFHEYDHDTKTTTIERVQDVQPFIDANKDQANNPDLMRKGIKQSWMKAATVPNVVIEQWLKEGIDFYNADHWPAVRRKLNSPEWKYLKTINGTI